MSIKELQLIKDAWSKHIDGTNRNRKLCKYSSLAEEDFCETFRNGIMNHPNLTEIEKLKLLKYTGLQLTNSL